MKSELAVGDSTWIELIFTTGSNKGTVSKSARVTTNDTIVGPISISFKVDAAEPTDSAYKLAAQPFQLDFGPIEAKRRPKLETKITNLSPEEMELSVVAYPPDYFKKVQLSNDDLKPGDDTKLKVELNRDREEEQFRKTITIEGKSKTNTDKIRITIPVIKGIGEEGAAKKETAAQKK
jgi:hypothetical protein